LLPNKVRGVARVDDRRVISGIIHVLKSGGRWVDAPACYGPRKTLPAMRPTRAALQLLDALPTVGRAHSQDRSARRSHCGYR
jgi:transposase